jgi:hypothetical protein
VPGGQATHEVAPLMMESDPDAQFWQVDWPVFG